MKKKDEDEMKLKNKQTNESFFGYFSVVYPRFLFK